MKTKKQDMSEDVVDDLSLLQSKPTFCLNIIRIWTKLKLQKDFESTF